MENLSPVIGSEYCSPEPIKLIIDTDKGATYINNELIFQVEKPSLTLHKRRLLRHFSGEPVLNLSRKIRSCHGRWQVFKHDSKDLVFSVKRSSFKSQGKNNIDLKVFLAENTEERDWDYKINAGSGQHSCVIYAPESSTILAKMMKNKGAFVGEVQPYVDYAFIVALITIVDEINNSRKLKMGKVIKSTLNVVEGAFAVAGMAAVVNDTVNFDDDDDDDDGDDDDGDGDVGNDDDDDA